MTSQLLLVLFSFSLVASKLITIDNTQPVTDIHGTPVNLHEGRLIQWKPKGKFYFYGMSYPLCNDTSIKCGAPHCGFRSDHNISVYSSPDMSQNSWKFERHIFDTTTPKRPPGVYFRMFIFYNQKTSKYVLWTMYDTEHFYMALTSTSPTGPFSVARTNISMGHSGRHGDFYGFKDDDGKGYIVYNTGGKIAVDELSDDFLSSTRKTTPLFDINGWQEAPLMFKRNGIYYVLTGHGCCVCLPGSDSNVWMSRTSPLGPYKFSMNIGAFGNGTSRTQSQMAFLSVIEQSNGKKMYLWSGDRWQQAKDGKHGHDPQIWMPLVFDENGEVKSLFKLEKFQIDVNV